MLTLISQRSRFDPSSERGNFLNLAKYGDIPSSHGDIPVVLCPISVIELKSTLNRVLSKFLPALGALFWLLQVSKMQVFMTCTIFKFGFSFDAKTYPIPGSYELHLRCYYLPFPVCSVSPAFQRIVQTNHFQETRELDSSISLENVSRTKENFFNNSHIQYLQSEQKSCGQETLNRWTEGLPLS